MSKHNTGSVHALSATPTIDQYPPTTKDLMLFIVMVRRNIRRTVAILDSQGDKARQYLRQARIIKERASPFDATRIAALEAMADDATAGCKPLYESLKECGKLLADAAPMIDAGTTLAQRCEALNVNVSDRCDLSETDGLHNIVFAHGLEDSPSRQELDWKNGPLFQALHLVFMEFLLNTKEGRDVGNSLFEPGGMFADVPMYTQAADGTMKRLPPRLYAVAAGPMTPVCAARDNAIHAVKSKLGRAWPAGT
jgi:hypothetical protein